ncbi:hypothetical protein L6452_00363 [Arctium lappa]|uniref:Uncharacterized protein n=1 Tax=Arctium lappa TaxID=4217 RepID=A0ACB9FDM7_ARCLA|nr:hypothetical protein L6452_00363 [Arctium lappa]
MFIDQEIDITYVLVVVFVSVLLVVVISCCTSWYDNPGVVVVQNNEMDIEMGRRPPPIEPPPTTTVIHQFIARLRQAEAATFDLPDMEEQKYKKSNSRSEKEDECVICMEEFKEMELIQIECFRLIF